MLESTLKDNFSGDVYFDLFTRGQYSTDASFYQILPAGVAIPKSKSDIEVALEAVTEAGISITGRGAGTSQSGQTVNSGLILDNSVHFNRILELDVEQRRCVVEPGIVLDELNRELKQHGLWFPVDISTASRATIGGMAANNSCGGRSLRYGTMRDSVRSIEAILHDGSTVQFGPVSSPQQFGNSLGEQITSYLLEIGKDFADLIDEKFPKLNRRVGGYNLDSLVPSSEQINLAHMLVGSEGTLGYFTKIELKLWPALGRRVLGVCHFPTFYQAMAATQHLISLNPIAIELVDSTMIDLSRQIPLFKATIEQFVRGEPDALLLVEFDEPTEDENLHKLKQLEELIGDIGFSWDGNQKEWGGVIPITDLELQARIAEVRKSGLNIMMSMKQEGKPISFVEDCAVALQDLPEYTRRLTDIFKKHGTIGTWYAHASVGCLHVRPILNLKLNTDVKKMRSIAEEAFELVAEYKGSHSGEHGDGIVRSEFHERMFGPEINNIFCRVKKLFDPNLRFNPGKIVNPPKMDDRSLFRYSESYEVKPITTVFDWSAWPGQGGGFQGAVEMCNNNGACRKLAGGTMCPSYRVTRNERDLTRGRANSLRLAMSGQLGPDALSSDEMKETMKLCVSCKGCKRECPTGVDVAKMKIETLAKRVESNGISLHDRLVAFLPRYAPIAARMPWLFNTRNFVPGIPFLMEKFADFSSNRKLPAWTSKWFSDFENSTPVDEADVVLFVDTFNRYFEPENIRAAIRVLESAGQPVAVVKSQSKRPLCCGRTFLSVGLVKEAKNEARRLIDSLYPLVKSGKTVLGLEPSCLLTLRDEISSLFPGTETDEIAEKTMMLEEYFTKLAEKGNLSLPLKPIGKKVLFHGHCHQKAFDMLPAIKQTLSMLPDTEFELIESSCCGMAGAFGYGRETEAISRQMGEISLFPAIRNEPSDAIIVADGTSCRHQIADGTGRQAIHIAKLLEMATVS